MLMTTDVHLERLMVLRDQGLPLAREMEKAGRLDFALVECGTYKCFWGWARTIDYFRRDAVRLYGGVITLGSTNEYFDISFDERTWLFGTPAAGTLSDRAAYLDKLIAKKLEELEVA